MLNKVRGMILQRKKSRMNLSSYQRMTMTVRTMNQMVMMQMFRLKRTSTRSQNKRSNTI